MSRSVRLAVFAVAVIGYPAGLAELAMHLARDPLADIHAYYDAGARLNAGLPLYPASADPNAADFYRYPPLTAIIFRPLAALPFPLAAGAWEALILAAFAITLCWPARGGAGRPPWCSARSHRPGCSPTC